MWYVLCMAKQQEPSEKTYVGATRYPWHEWMDGQWWLLERGVDYTATDASLRRAAYAHAKRKGMKVTVSIDKAEGVYVKFTPAKTLRKLR